jgi:Putative adhesin
MPTFETPTPIAARVVLTQGDLRVEAGDRTDTVVEIRPSDPAKREDVAAAERTSVELSDGRLSVVAPRTWRRYTWINDGSVDVRIALPEGSDLDAQADLAALGVIGRLADCRFRTGLGHIAVDRAGSAELRTGMGNVDVGAVDGRFTTSTGTGRIRVERVAGPTTVKNSNGATDIGAANGDVSVKSANGDITIARADGEITAKTAAGNIHVGAVGEGTMSAHTSVGDISIGVVAGTAAYLDLSTTHGHVDRDLQARTGPATDGPRAHILARTTAGDIEVHRVQPDLADDPTEGSHHV